MQLRSLLIGIVAGALLAHADPAVAQDPDSLPTPADDDRIDDEYEDDEEGDPRLRRALQAYLAELSAMTPPEIVGDTTAPGVQAGGTEIRVRVPGIETLVRDDPDDPRDAPPPEIYGEEICPSGNVRGQFEPVQGVWQDDPTFPDKPGKRIVRLSPVLWRAELPMVTGRKSLVFGVDRASDERRRNHIFLKGEASGSARIPVKFRFTLEQGGGETIVYESDVVGEIPIGKPCRPDAALPFEVSIDASDGLPPHGDPSYPEFTFADGDYLMEAELVTADGRETGLRVEVAGRSVTTTAPSIAFRVVNLLSAGRDLAVQGERQEQALGLSSEAASRIPDWFPLRNERLRTRAFPPRDRSDLLSVLARQPRFTELRSADRGEGYFEEGIREELHREMMVGGLMSGFDRLVVLLSPGDFRLVWHGSFHEDASLHAAAFAPSQKVVFVDLGEATLLETVAHEIVHTLPYIFSGNQMLAECDIDYHNVGSYRVGHGHRITLGSRTHANRVRLDNSPAIMGPVSYERVWITQCTYWHVLNVLSAEIPDPPVLLVQGFVSRTASGTAGFFQPFYELDGVEDLPRDGPGNWAIVLKDASGAVLARHAWEPQWRIPDLEPERTLVAFAWRLLRPNGLASVELEGPGGVFDTRSLSSAPVVTIVTPAQDAVARAIDGKVTVDWTVSDPDGDSVHSTVLYSPDGGLTWMDAVFETLATTAQVPIDGQAPADAHRILVRATDGGRSADAIVAFRPAE